MTAVGQRPSPPAALTPGSEAGWASKCRLIPGHPRARGRFAAARGGARPGPDGSGPAAAAGGRNPRHPRHPRPGPATPQGMAPPGAPQPARRSSAQMGTLPPARGGFKCHLATPRWILSIIVLQTRRDRYRQNNNKVLLETLSLLQRVVRGDEALSSKIGFLPPPTSPCPDVLKPSVLRVIFVLLLAIQQEWSRMNYSCRDSSPKIVPSLRSCPSGDQVFSLIGNCNFRGGKGTLSPNLAQKRKVAHAPLPRFFPSANDFVLCQWSR